MYVRSTHNPQVNWLCITLHGIWVLSRSKMRRAKKLVEVMVSTRYNDVVQCSMGPRQSLIIIPCWVLGCLWSIQGCHVISTFVAWEVIRWIHLGPGSRLVCCLCKHPSFCQLSAYIYTLNSCSIVGICTLFLQIASQEEQNAGGSWKVKGSVELNRCTTWFYHKKQEKPTHEASHIPRNVTPPLWHT